MSVRVEEGRKAMVPLWILWKMVVYGFEEGARTIQLNEKITNQITSNDPTK